ncbi:replication initiation protein [Endozoicomonas sp. ISHI1]|uniref:replication initiation protein n=1 Tax=Endozoicomonas sp. ISHI1 TaxID=2825882 RepID=UPI0021480B92|nr:replication initiation protein [Endozoicomonas sp. ISHI1]
MQSLTPSQETEKSPECKDSVDRFYELAPNKPYCTDDKASGLIIRSKNHAFAKSYVQHNTVAMCHWLTFDQDHDNLTQWEEAKLPQPNLIVRNLGNRKAHVSYAIESVCTSDAAYPKPMAYAQAIQEAYCDKLKADPGYTGFITKNPLHEDWHLWEIHSKVYKLGELADYVELKRRYWTRKRAANYAHYGLGRNCALFHRLRFWAYDWVVYHRDEQGTTYVEWMQIVLVKAEEYNDFPQSLPYGEIKSTAKSVGKWVWEKYFPKTKRKKRGAMVATFAKSELPLDLKTRQRLSARRTNQVRKETTENQIINAIGQLTAQGNKVNKASVSRLTGIHRNTLGRSYGHLFQSQK